MYRYIFLEEHNSAPIQLLINYLLLSILLLSPSCTSAQSTAWSHFASQFQEEYTSLQIPFIGLSYVNNFEAIPPLESIQRQEEFFTKIAQQINQFAPTTLPPNQYIEYQIIAYEIDLNQHRIALEKQWRTNKYKLTNQGIYHQPNGKEWYSYYLKKWVDKDITPQKVYDLGLHEIQRIKSNIKAIQQQSGLDSIAFANYIDLPSFFYTDIDSIQQAFEQRQQQVINTAKTIFPLVDQIPLPAIARGNNPALAQVPAFYSTDQQTFYYNYFDKPFNNRQIGWVYIHEAIPGHHYQHHINNIYNTSPLQELFQYYGYIEGYAAYIEEIGQQLNAYHNSYDELGKWEWDLIRAVRLVLDVGINYHGWDDQRALQFWQQHIAHQDDIAIREINRMKNWPAQVVTYKYGANKILDWRTQYTKDLSPTSLLHFHTQLLENGALPLSILENIFQQQNK